MNSHMWDYFSMFIWAGCSFILYKTFKSNFRWHPFVNVVLSIGLALPATVAIILAINVLEWLTLPNK